MLEYTTNDRVACDEFRDLLIRSTLAVRRPIDDRPCLQGMIDNANLVASCRHDGRLVGIARSVTDFHSCCYLADLAVDTKFQRQGIGRRLIEETRRQLGPRCQVVLLSAPAAVGYYPHLGFERHPECWTLARANPLRGTGPTDPP